MAGYGSVAALYTYATESDILVNKFHLRALLDNCSVYTGTYDWKKALDVVSAIAKDGYADIAKNSSYKECELFFVPRNGKFKTYFQNVNVSGKRYYFTGDSGSLGGHNWRLVKNTTPVATSDDIFHWKDYGWQQDPPSTAKFKVTTTYKGAPDYEAVAEHALTSEVSAGVYLFHTYFGITGENYHVQIGIAIVY